MYKVFINDKPIILTDSPQIGLSYDVYDYENLVLEEILHKIKQNKIKGILVYCHNLEKCWMGFQRNFKVIKAAGGLVVNNFEEILFIFRGNRWDLPKGRIEKNESIESAAIREVEEECGIKELILKNHLITTYHLFTQNNKNKLKITDWFLMRSNYQVKLTPQVEEGITIATFKNKYETREALQNTYTNIHLVLKTLGNDWLPAKN